VVETKELMRKVNKRRRKKSFKFWKSGRPKWEGKWEAKWEVYK